MTRDLMTVTLAEAEAVACPACGAEVGQTCLPDLRNSRDVRRLAETLADPGQALGRTHLARLRSAVGLTRIGD